MDNTYNTIPSLHILGADFKKRFKNKKETIYLCGAQKQSSQLMSCCPPFLWNRIIPSRLKLHYTFQTDQYIQLPGSMLCPR